MLTPALRACALTLPLYWPLATLSAVKSLVETVAAPMWWDKTEHGAGLKVGAGPKVGAGLEVGAREGRAPTTPSRRSPSSGDGGSLR